MIRVYEDLRLIQKQIQEIDAKVEENEIKTEMVDEKKSSHKIEEEKES